MSLRTRISSVLLASIGLFSPVVLADEGGFYVAPGLQWMDFDDTTGLKKDTDYFLGIGYDFTDRLSVELNMSDLDTELAGGGNIDVDQFKLDFYYDLGVDFGAFDSFVVAGLGNSNFEGNNDTLVAFGGGLSYQISDHWSWRTSLRSFMHQGRDREDYDIGIDTALVYRFKGNKRSRPEVARPATAAARPAANPAPEADADRDGVLDGRDKCPDTPRSYAVDADGCPIPEDEVARIELMVNFDFDRSEVKSEYFSEIEEVADFMAQFPDIDIELEGHTDSRGTAAYNQNLSERRVAAVRQVMINRFKVQASRVSVSGLGESKPIAKNETDAGRAQNRRVMTVIINTVQSYRTR